MKQIETYTEEGWRKLRATALRRDKYTDQYLKRYGKVKQAEMVHHIFPVEDFPEYQMCLWNLISLTIASHNKMHVRDTRELTDIGKQLLMETARKQNIPMPWDYLKRSERITKEHRQYIPPR